MTANYERTLTTLEKELFKAFMISQSKMEHRAEYDEYDREGIIAEYMALAGLVLKSDLKDEYEKFKAANSLPSL